LPLSAAHWTSATDKGKSGNNRCGRERIGNDEDADSKGDRSKCHFEIVRLGEIFDRDENTRHFWFWKLTRSISDGKNHAQKIGKAKGRDFVFFFLFVGAQAKVSEQFERSD